MAPMPLAAFIYGTVLTILGVVGFILALLAGGWHDPEALSALIPAGFGLTVLALAGVAPALELAHDIDGAGVGISGGQCNVAVKRYDCLPHVVESPAFECAVGE